MLEIEQKFANADFEDLENRLTALGATDFDALEEDDHYLQAPDRDFRATGEAFRLRRIGRKNFLTYKGPRQDAEVKIRPELELPLPDGDQAAEDFLHLFHLLGYRVVAVVRKLRRSYPLHRKAFELRICLDEVSGLGRYAEIEILAESARAPEARALLLEVASELGLQKVEKRSYLGMWLEKQGLDLRGGKPL